MPQRTAVIDIGTLKTKLIIAEFNFNNTEELDRKILFKDNELTLLGKNLDKNKNMLEESIKKNDRVLEKFMALIKHHNVDAFTVVATESLRSANNSQKVVDRIYRITGKHPEILSHEDEARIYFRTLSREIKGDITASDIGGGSIQIVTGHDNKIKNIYLLKTGIYILQQKYGEGEVLSRGKIKDEWEFIESEIKNLNIKKNPKAKFIYGSSNIIRFLQEAGVPLSNSGLGGNFPYKAKVEDLMQLYWNIIGLPMNEREKYYPSEPAFMWGADIAIINVVTLCNAFGVEEFIPSNTSIADGLLLDLVDQKEYVHIVLGNLI